MDKNQYLKNIYEDLGHAASYSGVDKLFKYVRHDRRDITRKDVERFLRSQLAYQHHGTVPRRFMRRPIKVSHPGSILGSDICDLTQDIAKHNEGYRYIFILMDLFSRKVQLTPLKNKSCENAARVLDNYLHNTQYDYSFFFSDQGGEYTGDPIQKIFKKYNIIRYNIFNRRFKNAIVERYIRDLKGLIHRHFTQNNTFKYLDVLPKIENHHNSSPHKGLGNETPEKVHQLTDLDEIKNQEMIQLRQKIRNYGNAIKQSEIAKSASDHYAFPQGTYVKLLLNSAEGVFAKSYEKLFTEEIFKIRKVDKRTPISYWLSDLGGEEIQGVVYHRELKRVEEPKEYYVEKIISLRKNKITGKREYLVKWRGYPDKFNSYVEEVRDIS